MRAVRVVAPLLIAAAVFGVLGATQDAPRTDGAEGKARSAAASEATPTVVRIAAAGDIACHPQSVHLAGGLGTFERCRQREISNILIRRDPDAVLMLGDAQYQRARLRNFERSYHPTWGRVLHKTWAIPGNHDYVPTTGKATGYFRYFGDRAGPGQRGFYSFDIGSWHFIGLNSNCRYIGETFGCAKGTPQEKWLRRDLAENDASCTIAFWHRPRFTSVTEEGDPLYPHSAFWKRLYAAGTDVILNAHVHHYERFAPQTPHGEYDKRYGIRQFIVGTGGSGCCVVPPDKERHQRAAAHAIGVLEMTLFPRRYKWRFISIDNHPAADFRDSGSGRCHGPPPRE